MLKKILNQIITYIIIVVLQLLFGLGIPILVDIGIYSVFFFSWIIAPIIAIVVTRYIIEYMKIVKVKLYIITSFILNFIFICLYTWIESLKPHIEGDFMDFRGLVFMIHGIGQIVGIIFGFLYFNFLKNKINN